MIPLFKVFMSEDVIAPVNEVLMSGSITQGKQVEKFEAALSEYLDTPYVLTLNSATSGLTLALRLLFKKCKDTDWCSFNRKTDFVLAPAMTCFATTCSIMANQVNIRWLDIDPCTMNISLNDLRKKLDSHTKVIYLVHWGGTPVDLDAISAICDEHKEHYGFRPMVVEDCAHAFGATYNGKKLGSYRYRNICVYSTQAIKHLTTGDGGIIVLPNAELYERANLLRWYGINRKKRNGYGTDFRLESNIDEWGYKFNMNDIAATIGLHNLPHIDRLGHITCNNAEYYEKELKDVSGIRLLVPPTKAQSAYWLYTLMILNDRKLEFIRYMNDNRVMVSQVHSRNDVNTCMEKFKETLPNLDITEREVVCIPVGWWVTHEDRAHIVTLIKEFMACIC